MGISEQLADAVAAASASVVRVEGRPGRVASGTVWAEGVVLTVARAVRTDDVEIGLPDGSTVKGTVVGREPLADLAVIRVEAKLTAARRADPSKLRIGSVVLPLGRPDREARPALGIVAGLAAEERVAPGVVLAPLIDVDGSLPPGFPGGPLIDDTGAILGINTRGLVRGGTTLPIGTLGPIVDRLLAHGTRRRGWLGIATHEAVLAASQAAVAGQPRGIAVVSVEADGPAGKAGVLVGDVVIGLEGPIGTAQDLVDRLVERGAGSTATLRVLRGAEAKDLAVTLGEAPERRWRCG